MAECARCGDGPRVVNQSYCSECKRHHDRRSYHSRKAVVAPSKARNRAASVRRNKALVLEHLASHPCIDCGLGDPVVLEFDHVRGRKRGDVSVLVGNGCSEATVLAEIAKCEVRCANCHRRQTAARRSPAVPT